MSCETGGFTVTDKVSLHTSRIIRQHLTQLFIINFKITDGAISTFQRILGNPQLSHNGIGACLDIGQ
ncbi:hypothetical protein D3C81_1361250 [compost metagenome]